MSLRTSSLRRTLRWSADESSVGGRAEPSRDARRVGSEGGDGERYGFSGSVALLIGLVGGFGGLTAGTLIAERGQRTRASAPAVASAVECPTCADAAPTLSAVYPEAIQWSRKEPLTADTIRCEFRILADTDQQNERAKRSFSRSK